MKHTLAYFFADLAAFFTRYVDAAREALLQEVSEADPDAVDVAPVTAIEMIPSIWPERPSIAVRVDLAGYRVNCYRCADNTVYWSEIYRLCDQCGVEARHHYEAGQVKLCPACYAALSAVRSQLAGA